MCTRPAAPRAPFDSTTPIDILAETCLAKRLCSFTWRSLLRAAGQPTGSKPKPSVRGRQVQHFESVRHRLQQKHAYLLQVVAHSYTDKLSRQARHHSPANKSTTFHAQRISTASLRSKLTNMQDFAQQLWESAELQRQLNVRKENEAAEMEHRSRAYALRRCRKELGIIDPGMSSTIADAILAAEKEERRELTALHIYTRELQRLEVMAEEATCPRERADINRRVKESDRSVAKAQAELDRGQYIRTQKLRKMINLTKVESSRLAGGTIAERLADRIAAGAPDAAGTVIPWDTGTIKIGGANDYLTIHNPAYPRRTQNTDIGPHFRNILMQGQKVEICALKHGQAYHYGQMMENIDCSKPEPGLLTPRIDPKRKTKLPVYGRMLDLAGDAGRGRGYALALKSHDADGPFYGIASYNTVTNISPREFFGNAHFDGAQCRMVDFSFHVLPGRLSEAEVIEIGTLLIEHARVYFGARLFRSECNPLNARYSDAMAALGLSKFKAVEPASYNANLAAATWKFDFCAWKSVTSTLRSQGQWYVEQDFMKDPDEERRPPHPDPQEPLPALAVIEAAPTVHDDPAAYEAQPPQSAQGGQALQVVQQGSQTLEWSSSYISGTMETSDSETTSGAGHSDSSPSNSAASNSHAASSRSSSASSASGCHGGSEALIIRGQQVMETAKKARDDIWQGNPSSKSRKYKQDSLAMPPPPRPIVLGVPPRAVSSPAPPSASPRTADYPDMPMEMEPQYTSPYNSKGKGSDSVKWLGQPSPATEQEEPEAASHEKASMELVLYEPASYEPNASEPESHGITHCDTRDPKGKRSTSSPCLDQPGPSTESAPDASVPSEPVLHEPTPPESSLYGSNGKRPASVSWETQPKKRSPLYQSPTPDGSIHSNARPPGAPLYDGEQWQHSEAASEGYHWPQAVISSFANSNRQSSSPTTFINYSARDRATTASPTFSQPESTTYSASHRFIIWQGSQVSPENDGFSHFSHSPPMSHPQQADFSMSNTSWNSTLNVYGEQSSEVEPMSVIHDLHPTQSTGSPPSDSRAMASAMGSHRQNDGWQSDTEMVSFPDGLARPSDTSPPIMSVESCSDSTPFDQKTHRRASAAHSGQPGLGLSFTSLQPPNATATAIAPPRPMLSPLPARCNGPGPSDYQQPAESTEQVMCGGADTQLSSSTQYCVGLQEAPERYNLAVYNYVEFVEESPPQYQIQATQAEAVVSTESECPSSASKRQHRPQGPQRGRAAKPASQSQPGRGAPASRATKFPQKSSGVYQCTIPTPRQMDDTNRINKPKQHKIQCAQQASTNQAGPSDSVMSLQPQDKRQGRKRQPSASPRKTLRTKTVQQDSTLAASANTASVAETRSTSGRYGSSPAIAHPYIYSAQFTPSVPLTHADYPPSQQDFTQQKAPRHVAPHGTIARNAMAHQTIAQQALDRQPLATVHANVEQNAGAIVFQSPHYQGQCAGTDAMATEAQTKLRPWQL